MAARRIALLDTKWLLCRHSEERSLLTLALVNIRPCACGQRHAFEKAARSVTRHRATKSLKNRGLHLHSRAVGFLRAV